MIIRNYKTEDYQKIIELYKNSTLYGGQFDEARDSEEKLNKITSIDPEAILMAEENGKILGTLSLIEDGRVAWLFRFAVLSGNHSEEVIKSLYNKAAEVLKSRGHEQVLVYAPAKDASFVQRYQKILGFELGNDFTCYWKII